MMDKRIIAFLLLLVVVIAKEEKNAFITAPNSDLDLDSFHTFSPANAASFKTFAIGNDKNTLFIGARDKVFGQRMSDIRTDAISPFTWPVAKDSQCKLLPQSNGGKKCFNQIQTIHQLNSTHFLMCGSNSMNPKNYMLVRDTVAGEFSMIENHSFRSALCSFDPNDSVTSLQIANGVSSEFVSTTRISINTEISLSKLMTDSVVASQQGMFGDQSRYVAMFFANDSTSSHTMAKVYSVSVEKASELNPTKPMPTPTITQVCANDIGGENVLRNKWTSLLKVRLSCATTDEYPLDFKLITDMVQGRDGILYGTFMTPYETTRSNAVCSFRLSDIQKAFNGSTFWDTKKKPHTKTQAPNLSPYHPGMCAYSGMDPSQPDKSTSKKFSNKFLNFMASNSLVDGVVTPAYPPVKNAANTTPVSKAPLFVKAGEKFTKIGVHKVTDLTGVPHDVLFVAKDDGHIHKFVSIVKNSNFETIELALYRPTKEPIISMILSQEKGQLYVGTEKGVHQLSTSNCAAYTKSCEFCNPCQMCILSRDPGCAWDMSSKQCVKVENGNRDSMKQDVYYGDATTQCGNTAKTGPVHMQVSKRGTGILGNVITNPTVKATWYKYDSADSSTKKQISDVDKKYRIKMDGQLQIMNFDPSKDSAIYECQYAVGSTILNTTSYSISAASSSPDKTPVVTVPPGNKPTKSNPDDSTGDPKSGITDEIQTTSATPVATADSSLVGGLAAALALVILMVVVVVACFYCRRKNKFSPKGQKTGVASDGPSSPRSKENISANNNTGLERVQSEYDGRPNQPLLMSTEHQFSVLTDVEAAPRSQRNTKSLDNIMDKRDEMEYIDDSDSSSDIRPARQSSMREKSGRQRVPPTRTKSMPGSALYVVYAGKKLMCSTLQRNKQGAWTVEVKPNQSGMSDMAGDEVIDIINDDPAEVKFSPTPENKAFLGPKLESSSRMKDARKAFFEGDQGIFSPDDSPSTVNYVTSTPSSYVSQKPKVAPKPPGLVERAASMRKPLVEKPSQSSLRSLGQNSSEDRDSDSTVKGSVLTLKPDDTPSSFNTNPTKENHSQHSAASGSIAVPVPTMEPTSDVPTTAHSGHKKRKSKGNANSGSLEKPGDRQDRSSGSSDGDEHLHGRDKDVKRKSRNTPIDSPSKQSRTSHGSSSSGDYKSARSSVISDQDHR